MPMYNTCPANCIQKNAHSICAMAPRFHTKILDQMITKVEQLPNTKQGLRMLAEYAGVDAKLQTLPVD